MDTKELLANPLLSFRYVAMDKTDKRVSYRFAEYKGLKFKVYDPTKSHPNGRITIGGSLHIYWNKGEHNYNDLSIIGVYEVLGDLRCKFGLDPSNCILKQVEIGVNLVHNLLSKTIIDGCKFHRKKRFETADTNSEGKYFKVVHQVFTAKIYDKRMHYFKKFKIQKEIIRFEIKYTKMKYLNSLGIYNLNDLIVIGFDKFESILTGLWNGILFYDSIVFDNTENQYRYNCHSFWEGLELEKYKYEQKKLNKAIKNSPNSIKCYVEKLIIEKVRELNVVFPLNNHLSIRLNKGIPNYERKFL